MSAVDDERRKALQRLAQAEQESEEQEDKEKKPKAVRMIPAREAGFHPQYGRIFKANIS